MERQIWMSRLFSIRYLTWCSLIMVSGLIMGCSFKTAVALPTTAVATPSIKVESRERVQWPDNDLPGRFQQYWTLRKAGDAAGTFELEAPHVREMVVWGRYEGFCKHVRNDWLSIRIEKINIITEQLIEIDFNMVANNKEKEGAKKDIFFRDSWLFFSGQWFHVLKDPFVTGDGLGK
jgi:hypothetical protein